MANLTWASKTSPAPLHAAFELDSIIYPQGAGYAPTLPNLPFQSEETSPNRLLLGDNLAAMSALLPVEEGHLSLIYADPPFFTNRRFSARIGRGEDSRRPQDWQLAAGYPDHWADLDAYLDFLYPRLALMYRLLAPTGTLYLHLDWHADAYARVLLDEIFGPNRLLNQIAWVYHGPSPIRSAFNRKHDTILVYTKGDGYTFNADAVRQPYNPVTVKTFASSARAGFGKVPNLERGKVPEDWWYFPVVARLHNERTGYPTQKPEALLERMILASSNPGDLVADFFCGSGTTPVVAARLGRRFIASDIISRAVATTRARLVEAASPPFQVEILQGSRFVELAPVPRTWGRTHQTLACSIDLLPSLDYWEVDPAWDGKVFRSAAQAVRPRKDHPIASQLTLPLVSEDQPVCVRWVTVNGEHYQGEIT